MLRLHVLAFALMPLLLAAPSNAETIKSEAAVTAPAASAAKQQETAAADPVSAEPAADAGDVGAAKAPQAEVKAAEPEKKAEPKPVPTTMTVQIDLARQTMTVSEHGDVKYTWPISSGTSEHPTPRGTFRPQWTAKMWYSKKYDNAPMPNAVFISGGVAIHATPYTRYLGSPASHGCIRLAPGNAATFYRLVHQHGLKATKVSVYGTPKWRAPAVASRRDRDEQPTRRYAVQEQNNGFFGLWGSGSSYKATSAYDPGFIQQQRKMRRPVRVYANGNAPRRVVYRSYDGSRVYYVQRPQRRVYYGYGSGW
jgi:lipoprotein-anchoring transpeptidase ErfK/SrfK